jgi:hypothetical protein
MEQIKEEPKFKIGDKVNRIQEEEPKSAIITEIIYLDEYTYRILYDEKEIIETENIIDDIIVKNTITNDIYGWWPESALEM